MTTEFTYKNLPPVGLVCEVDLNGVYTECEILAHYDPCRDGDLVAVFAYETRGGRSTDQRVGPCFRPIKTAEDIAADKRLHQIRNALTAIHAGDQKFPNDLVRGNIIAATVEAMIDAGYRKFQIVQDDV